MRQVTKVALIVSLLFFLISCQSRNHWQAMKIKTGNSKFDSKKITYPSSNYNHDLEIEFLQIGPQLCGYINLFLHEAKKATDPTKSEVLFLAKQEKLSFHFERLQGGQRLKIPENLIEPILELFKKHQVITMKIAPSYEVKIHLKHFQSDLKKLKKSSLDFLPNHPVGFSL
jgi:hypothetical protein